MTVASLSVVVPALNEEMNLEATIKSIQETAPLFFEEWEILIFNDGSTDATGKIADRLARSESRIRVFHHAKPINIGGCYKEGIQRAKNQYLIMIPGDNECGAEVMKRVFSRAGTADMIIPYTSNHEVRPWGRRVLSKLFVWWINRVGGHNLHYYNGAVLHRTELLRSIPIRTDGFGYQAEILLKLLSKGHSYNEVGIEITYRPFGSSKAISPSSLIRMGRFLFQLTFQRNFA